MSSRRITPAEPEASLSPHVLRFPPGSFFAQIDSSRPQDSESLMAIIRALCMVDVPSMKSLLLEKIRIELKGRLERLAKAALDAHAAATDPDSKAEGKYDTRSLEASYLAAGQARQVDELAAAVRIFEALTLPDFTIEDAITMGALVEADIRGETSLLLLAPTAGGMVLHMDGQEITLLTPASTLYQNLLGMRAGDFLEELGLLVIEVS